jgi:hypothetical protein
MVSPHGVYENIKFFGDITIARSILDGYKLILTSLLASMGIFTNQQRFFVFAWHVRVAMISPLNTVSKMVTDVLLSMADVSIIIYNGS